MKVVFTIKALSQRGGGAERVLTQIASGLAARGHEVIVISNDGPKALPYYSVDASVQLIRTGVGDVSRRTGIRSALRQLFVLRRTIRAVRPDVVVSFMHSSYVPVGIALIFTGMPVVASEHSTPWRYRGRPLERALMAATPLWTKHITVVSEQVRAAFGPWLRKKMVAVPNPVYSFCEVDKLNKSPTAARRVLLSVGRLEVEKDHAVLISAFKDLAPDFPEWNLRIVGHGSLYDVLAKQIDASGLQGRVELAGAVRDMSSEYAEASIFVLPSRYESFGLATAEALLAGLPAVGFLECPGTNELIRDGENGRLVGPGERVQMLGSVLRDLMVNDAEQLRLADAPKAWIKEKYDIHAVLQAWESLLLQLAR